MYRVYRLDIFKKKIKKYSPEFQRWVDKVENQLKLNPYVGDPIYVEWFREKRRDNFRLYFYIFEDLKGVYLAGISDKDNQQIVIDTLWLFFQVEKDTLRNTFEQQGN
ncbi:MAG: hypothetical protein Q8L34_04135 [Candidatus Woesearchaeota archaeon]|nr:hypothetical protein [Candidatus Woesearchaeota archaeon]